MQEEVIRVGLCALEELPEDFKDYKEVIVSLSTDGPYHAERAENGKETVKITKEMHALMFPDLMGPPTAAPRGKAHVEVHYVGMAPSIDKTSSPWKEGDGTADPSARPSDTGAGARASSVEARAGG